MPVLRTHQPQKKNDLRTRVLSFLLISGLLTSCTQLPNRQPTDGYGVRQVSGHYEASPLEYVFCDHNGSSQSCQEVTPKTRSAEQPNIDYRNLRPGINSPIPLADPGIHTVRKETESIDSKLVRGIPDTAKLNIPADIVQPLSKRPIKSSLARKNESFAASMQALHSIPEKVSKISTEFVSPLDDVGLNGGDLTQSLRQQTNLSALKDAPGWVQVPPRRLSVLTKTIDDTNWEEVPPPSSTDLINDQPIGSKNTTTTTRQSNFTIPVKQGQLSVHPNIQSLLPKGFDATSVAIKAINIKNYQSFERELKDIFTTSLALPESKISLTLDSENKHTDLINKAITSHFDVHIFY